MKFSTKSRYALRLMAELARYAPGTTVSLKEISERQNLSLKYLEQIVTPLARVGLVKSERGSQGGYRLTKAPADYTAGEILRAIEGSVAPIPCLGSETNECPMWEQCFTLPFWTGLDEVINQYIDSVTLELSTILKMCLLCEVQEICQMASVRSSQTSLCSQNARLLEAVQQPEHEEQ